MQALSASKDPDLHVNEFLKIEQQIRDTLAVRLTSSRAFARMRVRI